MQNPTNYSRFCFVSLVCTTTLFILYFLPSKILHEPVSDIVDFIEIRFIYVTLLFLAFYYVPLQLFHSFLGRKITSALLSDIYHFIIFVYAVSLNLIILDLNANLPYQLINKTGAAGQFALRLFLGHATLGLALIICIVSVLFALPLLKSEYLKRFVGQQFAKSQERLKPVYFLFLSVTIISFFHQIILSFTITDWHQEHVLHQPSKANLPPIFIFVFDAFTANDSDLYGYSRPTTPNLKMLAKESHCYKYHFSGSVTTGPSTASILTGQEVLHHFLLQNNWRPRKEHKKGNVFVLMKSLGYTTVAYSHNPNVEVLLQSFSQDINEFIPTHTLYADIDPICYAMSLFLKDGTYYNCRGSSVSNPVVSVRNPAIKEPSHRPEYVGRPDYFVEDVFLWFANYLRSHRDKAIFSYIHMFPPHDPYRYKKSFGTAFQDIEVPVVHSPTKVPVSYNMDAKKHMVHNTEHLQKFNEQDYKRERLKYDRLIASIDEAFGHFINTLKEMDLYDPGYIIVTSDHGEIFKNNMIGHGWYMYSDLNRVPLLIKAPYQEEGFVHEAFTSAVDIIPTLLKQLDQPIPESLDGHVLPAFCEKHQESRPIWSVETNGQTATKAGFIHIALMRYPYKYIYYQEINKEEFYNLREDPHETHDLSIELPDIVKDFRQETLRYIKQNQHKEFLNSQKGA